MWQVSKLSGKKYPRGFNEAKNVPDALTGSTCHEWSAQSSA
jgi:hypothetical protein